MKTRLLLKVRNHAEMTYDEQRVKKAEKQVKKYKKTAKNEQKSS